MRNTICRTYCKRGGSAVISQFYRSGTAQTAAMKRKANFSAEKSTFLAFIPAFRIWTWAMSMVNGLKVKNRSSPPAGFPSGALADKLCCPEIEFLDINLTKDSSLLLHRWNSWTSMWQKTRVYCSLLFIVPSAGGFYWKSLSTLVLKIKTN